MKLIQTRIIIYVTLFMMAIVACDQDNVKTKIDANGVDYVAVAVTAVDEPYKLNADNTYTISFPIHRTYKNVSGTTAELTLESNDDTGLFILEDESLTFDAGSAVAYAKIKATNPSAIDPAMTYTFELKVVGDNASLLFNTAAFSGQLELSFESAGTATMVSSFYDDTWNVEMFKAEGLDIYKAQALYEEGYDILLIVDEGLGTVSIPEQKGWFHGGVELPVRIGGSGTVVNNGQMIFTMQIEHYLPEYDHTWGFWDEELTMP
ncbi:MAG: hypothetical protein N4A74_03745 [Carboxylicivirga sp.]|jgi:hypothetical protein|nr:hypothetical protein [Carboxylicivirga sp.]